MNDRGETNVREYGAGLLRVPVVCLQPPGESADKVNYLLVNFIIPRWVKLLGNTISEKVT